MDRLPRPLPGPENAAPFAASPLELEFAWLRMVQCTSGNRAGAALLLAQARVERLREGSEDPDAPLWLAKAKVLGHNRLSPHALHDMGL